MDILQKIKEDKRLFQFTAHVQNNWSKLRPKDYENISDVINKEATKFIVNHPNADQILSDLGLKNENFFGKENEKSFSSHMRGMPQHIKSQSGFIQYYKNNLEEFFKWKNEKTISRIFNSENKPRSQTLYIFLAFLGVEYEFWDEKIKNHNKESSSQSRLIGYFQFYNVENFPSSRLCFQRAQLIITDDQSEFIYENNQTGKKRTAEVIVHESINRKTIPLEILGNGFVVKLNVKVTPGSNVILGQYIYSSEIEEQYAGQLVLEKLESFAELKEPARSTPSIPNRIKHFLALLPQLTDKNEFRLKNEKDESKQGQIFRLLKKYIGVYYLYCNKKYDYPQIKEPSPSGNLFIGWIGQDVFEIYEGDKPNQLCCKLKTRKNHDKYGEIIIDETAGSAYIICSMHDKDSPSSRFLNLIIHRGTGSGKEELLFGTFNTVYASENPAGCGLLVMKKIPNGVYGNIAPGIINPLTDVIYLNESNDPNPIDKSLKQFISYLCFDGNARLECLRERKEFYNNSKLCDYHGTYKIYSYGRVKNDEKLSTQEIWSKVITKGALKISPYGFVEHKGDYNRENAEGYVQLINRNLLITLVNKDGNKRTGTIFLKVDSNYPKKGRIYTGTFSGISPNSGRALGNRIILEYCHDTTFDEIKPSRIDIYDPEVNKKLDPRIRKALMGRWINFIGFYERAGIFDLRKLGEENKNQLHIGEKFFNSACFLIIHKKNLTEGIIDFRRALEHGYGNFQEFEDQIKEKASLQVCEEVITHALYIELESQYSSLGGNERST